MGISEELASMDATAQAELVTRGELSPKELVEAACERLERTNPQLNAVIHPALDRARALATSPVMNTARSTGIGTPSSRWRAKNVARSMPGTYSIAMK